MNINTASTNYCNSKFKMLKDHPHDHLPLDAGVFLSQTLTGMSTSLASNMAVLMKRPHGLAEAEFTRSLLNCIMFSMLP